MRRRLLMSALLICAGTAPVLYAQARQATPPPAAAPAATNNVMVTVSYTGKGVVDATHKIMVFLFATPTVDQTSQPLGAPQILEKNGATATFMNVTAKPVYIVALYDEKGGYTGRGGPPPVGTPMAMHGKVQKDPKAPGIPVTPGAKTPVKMSFSDARRWQ